MSKTLIRVSFVSAFLAIGSYASGNLLFGYLVAIFGNPSAQWQFAFLFTPIPIVLGVISLVISLTTNPRLSKFYIALCLTNIVLPIVLSILVASHVY